MAQNVTEVVSSDEQSQEMAAKRDRARQKQKSSAEALLFLCPERESSL